MTKVGSLERAFDFGIWGRIGRGYEYGEKINGNTSYGNQENYNAGAEYGARVYGDFFYGKTGKVWGIYQRRHNKGKKIYTRLKFYIPTNPRTVPQQSNRSKFASGMSEWASLTQNEKNVYNERAKRKQVHGVNLFLTEYLKSN